MRTLIERLEQWYEYHEKRGDKESKEDYNALIKFATELLEKERELARQAYQEGYKDASEKKDSNTGGYLHKQGL